MRSYDLVARGRGGIGGLHRRTPEILAARRSMFIQEDGLARDLLCLIGLAKAAS